MDMSDLKISVKHENLEELKGLLQKATNQVEQLKGTLKEIEEFESVSKVI